MHCQVLFVFVETDMSYIVLILLLNSVYNTLNTPNAVCRSYEFTCDNGECIFDSDACDGIENWADGSDENGCRKFLGSYSTGTP